MIIRQEEYGADADGNRGVMVWDYDLEDSDYEEVKEKVIQAMWDDGYSLDDLPHSIIIGMYDYINDDIVDMVVSPKDYLD